MKKFVLFLCLFVPFFVDAKVNERNVVNLKETRETLHSIEDLNTPTFIYDPEFEDSKYHIMGAGNRIVVYDKKKDTYESYDFDKDDKLFFIKKFGNRYLIASDIDSGHAFYLLDSNFKILNRRAHPSTYFSSGNIIGDKYFVTYGKNRITVYDNNLDVVRNYNLGNVYNYIEMTYTNDCAYFLAYNTDSLQYNPHMALYLDFDNLLPGGLVHAKDINSISHGSFKDVFLGNAIIFERDYKVNDKNMYNIKLIAPDFSVVKEKYLELPVIIENVKVKGDYIYAVYDKGGSSNWMTDSVDSAFKFDKDLNYLGSVDNPFKTKESFVRDNASKDFEKTPKFSEIYDNLDGTYLYLVKGKYQGKDKSEVRVFSDKEKKDILKVPFPYDFDDVTGFTKYGDYYFITIDKDTVSSFCILDSNFKVLKKIDNELGDDRESHSHKAHLKKDGFYYILASRESVPDVTKNPKVELIKYDMLFFPDVIENKDGDVSVSVIPTVKGNVVSVSVEPKEGYNFKRLKVLDSDKNEVEVKGLSFVMPNSDVTIEAIFEPVGVLDNPNTSDVIAMIFGIFGISLVMGIYFYNKKKILS